MHRKKIVLVIAILIATTAYWSTTVYVLPGGSKYHSQSHYAGRERIKMSRFKATVKGYEACNIDGVELLFNKEAK